MKKYQVTLEVSNIEANNKTEAINEFDNLIREGVFDEVSYKVKQEQDKTEQCSNCDEQLQDDYDNVNGLCVQCHNKA